MVEPDAAVPIHLPLDELLDPEAIVTLRQIARQVLPSVIRDAGPGIEAQERYVQDWACAALGRLAARHPEGAEAVRVAAVAGLAAMVLAELEDRHELALAVPAGHA